MKQVGPPDPPLGVASRPDDSAGREVPRRFSIADLVVDVGTLQVTRAGVPVPLPGLSFDLLVVLARAAPDVVTHEQLIQRVWRGGVVGPETISQRVKLLRAALGDESREPRYVAGVRGRGYRLVPAVVPLPEPLAIAPPSVPPLQPASTAPATPDDAQPGDLLSPSRRATRLHAGRLGATLAVVALIGVALYATRAAWLYDPPMSAAGAVRAPEPAPATTASASMAGSSANVAGLPVRSVAVLPFQNLSVDSANDFIGLGVAELVLNRLAESPALFVVARSSSFSFEGRNVDAREIGRQLGVRYLVQGSVQRAGDALRVTAQVVDATSGKQMKSMVVDRRIDDLFALQDEIASAVAASLDGSLVARKPAVPPSRRADAQLAYLQGLRALGRWRVGEAEAAIGHFLRVQQLEPDFAPAYVGEAQARVRVAGLTGNGEAAARALARRLARRALELDPMLGSAHVLDAALSEPGPDTERRLRDAIRRAPNDAQAYAALADSRHLPPGRGREALELIDRAVALDPLQPRYRYLRGLLASVVRPDVDAFEAAMIDVLRVDPEYTQALTRLAQLNAAARGQFAEAIAYAERAVASDPRSAYALETLALLHLSVDDPAAAADVFRSGGPPDPIRALFALYAGDLEEAARLARRAVDAGPVHLGAIDSTPEIAVIVALSGDAFRSRDFAGAMRAIRSRYCPDERGPGCGEGRVAAAALADLELAAGDRAAGEARLRRVVSAPAPVTPNAQRVAQLLRVKALLQLGRREEALREFATAQRGRLFVGWWLWMERDPGLRALQDDARAAAAEFRRQAAVERARLEQMRREGRVPLRPAS